MGRFACINTKLDKRKFLINKTLESLTINVCSPKVKNYFVTIATQTFFMASTIINWIQPSTPDNVIENSAIGFALAGMFSNYSDNFALSWPKLNPFTFEGIKELTNLIKSTCTTEEIEYDRRKIPLKLLVCKLEKLDNETLILPTNPPGTLGNWFKLQTNKLNLLILNLEADGDKLDKFSKTSRNISKAVDEMLRFWPCEHALSSKNFVKKCQYLLNTPRFDALGFYRINIEDDTSMLEALSKLVSLVNKKSLMVPSFIEISDYKRSRKSNAISEKLDFLEKTVSNYMSNITSLGLGDIKIAIEQLMEINVKYDGYSPVAWKVLRERTRIDNLDDTHAFVLALYRIYLFFGKQRGLTLKYPVRECSEIKRFIDFFELKREVSQAINFKQRLYSLYFLVENNICEDQKFEDEDKEKIINMTNELELLLKKYTNDDDEQPEDSNSWLGYDYDSGWGYEFPSSEFEGRTIRFP